VHIRRSDGTGHLRAHDDPACLPGSVLLPVRHHGWPEGLSSAGTVRNLHHGSLNTAMKRQTFLLTVGAAMALLGIEQVATAQRLTSLFADRLQGDVLTEERVALGMTVPLNSVIVSPSYERSDPSDRIAVVNFRRADLTSDFVDRLFDPTNRDIRVIHPFAARGVEAVLTANELIILIHRGVGLHLRNDVQFFPGFRTFRADDVVGIVTFVNAEFLISRDQGIVERRLGDFWTMYFGPNLRCGPGDACVRGKDGSYSGSFSEAQVPAQFPPRVAE
jgi:hypothetical protein